MNLQTNKDNPRTITADAYDKLKRSIERNPDGLTANKIAYKDGIIISGNQRYRAILELGLTIKPEWLKDLSGWTQEQIDEWVIQSNISAGEWDWDILANEWEADNLIDWGIDMPDDWGTSKELPEDIDEIPEVKTPVSKLGDLWLLNGHRVLCGDSTDKTTVERLMDGKKADMVFTDPPYGINEQTDRAFASPTRKAKGNSFPKILGDMTTEVAIKAIELFKDVPIQVIFGGNYFCHSLPETANWLVWDKRIEENQRDMNSDCELAWVKSKTNSVRIFRHLWKGMIKGSEQGQGRVHPTQKPIALAEFAFNEYGKDSKIILDLFLGSGSTLIACEQTDRICYGLELDPLYVDVICKRWQTLTGQMPILESSGEAHDFMVQ